jgi:hypothetical protein
LRRQAVNLPFAFALIFVLKDFQAIHFDWLRKLDLWTSDWQRRRPSEPVQRSDERHVSVVDWNSLSSVNKPCFGHYTLLNDIMK